MFLCIYTCMCVKAHVWRSEYNFSNQFSLSNVDPVNRVRSYFGSRHLCTEPYQCLITYHHHFPKSFCLVNKLYCHGVTGPHRCRFIWVSWDTGCSCTNTTIILFFINHSICLHLKWYPTSWLPPPPTTPSHICPILSLLPVWVCSPTHLHSPAPLKIFISVPVSCLQVSIYIWILATQESSGPPPPPKLESQAT